MSWTDDKIVHSKAPLNAEPVAAQLLQSSVTKVSQTYHRNHGETPADAVEAIKSNRRLDWEIDLVVESGALSGEKVDPLCIRLRDLQELHPKVEEPIALSCAGLRRTLFAHAGPTTEGIAWEEQTVANAVWGGCLLRDVLKRHVPRLEKSSNWHAIFESSQDCGEEEGGVFGGSIPGDVALDDEVPVLLAWQQNGEDLTLAHGGPLRVVGPGIIGARSIKWLRKITISSQPSQHHAMVSDYKQIPAADDGQLHPSDVEKKNLAEHKDELMKKTEPMQWSPMQCSVGEATILDTSNGRRLRVKGFALGERGVPIKEIQVTTLPVPRRADSSDTNHHNEDRDEEITRRAADLDEWLTIPIEYGKAAGQAATRSFSSDTTSWDGKKRWDWVLFDAKLDVGTDFGQRAELENDSSKVWVVVARAMDVTGRMQARWPAWNLRGVGFDGWSVKDVQH